MNLNKKYEMQYYLSSNELSLLSDFERENFFEKFFLDLESGLLTSVFFDNQRWVVNHEVQQTILNFFKFNQKKEIKGYPYSLDKLSLLHPNAHVRAVPGSIIRRGAYIGINTVLMPSFINVGAWVGDGTMIDTWSTIGSCAHIGKNCHISGGVGIGGVLEPAGSMPVIIEDDCFIGARSEIAEGVLVQKGSVIASGVFLTQSTRIYNRLTDEISYGVIPEYSVVVPGTYQLNEMISVQCAVIMKKRDQKTNQKVCLNEVLRESSIIC